MQSDEKNCARPGTNGCKELPARSGCIPALYKKEKARDIGIPRAGIYPHCTRNKLGACCFQTRELRPKLLKLILTKDLDHQRLCLLPERKRTGNRLASFFGDRDDMLLSVVAHTQRRSING